MTAPAEPARPRVVLLVDDDPIQRKLARLRLLAAGFEVEAATGADEALRRALARTPDVILSDVLMGDLDGFALCRRLRREPSLAAVPIVLVSAHYQDAPDQALATAVGAAALVARTPDFDAELAALHASLAHVPAGRDPSDPSLFEQHLRTNATQLTRLLGKARDAEERYRTLFEHAHDAIAILDLEGNVVEANRRWSELVGVPAAELAGMRVGDLAAPGHAASTTERFQRTAAAGGRVRAVPLRRRDGAVFYMQFSNTVIELDGRRHVFSIGHEVTAEIEAARSLAAAERKYRTLVERIPDVVWTADETGAFTFVSSSVERVCGMRDETLLAGGVPLWLDRVHPDDVDRVRAAYEGPGAGLRRPDLEYRWRHTDGRWIWLRDRIIAAYDQDGLRCLDGMVSDVTERRHLEESFHQSQKMEAIGQLTGGIAHDFNNMLAAILSNTHFLLEDLGPQDPRRADVAEIQTAAERAATLTRQLLAFSRRQVLAPSVVDLAGVVTGLGKMLRRLIGEDIAFRVEPGAVPGAVRVDVGQLEQVIMNLVVNARDAMPAGGALTIATANVDLDEPRTGDPGLVPPGRYAMLSVADTGCGMDLETRRRIFEPFFTTKGLGHGTGLGLSTCYGIVQQSGGHIVVHSEVGRGTRFEIYLPRVGEAPVIAPAREEAVPERGGSETVLVVEDDDALRTAVQRLLEPRGYHLLVARDGAEAVSLAAAHPDRIDLVLSDVVMPGACGPEVVERVRALSPRARALFMSGYSDHPVLRTGAVPGGLHFIQKPFAAHVLTRKVRDVLDA